MVKKIKGAIMHIHRVKECESIHDIAKEYGISPIKIAENNDIDLRAKLPVGRELIITIPSRTYNVKSTDTLDTIAKRFNTDKNSLLRLNPELMGREKLYCGQLLTIKDSAPRRGTVSVNGYLYSGTPKERLISLLPHLSFVTVSSAIYKDSKVHSLFGSDDTVTLIRHHGKTPILRIYLNDLPPAGCEKDFASSISILAASGRFDGIALSSLNSLNNSKERLDSLVFTVRKTLLENDMLLFVEGDAEKNTSYIDYADAGILTYDKLHKESIPCFNDGERKVFENFANTAESSRAFMEISSFAYSSGKYIEKQEAMRITDKKRGEIQADDERLLQRAIYGKGKKKEIVYESLENTKAKLELVGELGFMGVSFDIGRVCIPDLMAVAATFDLISCPVMMPKNKSMDSLKKCNP